MGNKLVKHGWGAYFGKSAYPGLFRKKNKVWGKQRVHPKLKLIGKKGFSLKNPIKHYYCEDISDMIKKLDNYSSAKALDLLDENTKETGFRNFRRIFSRFWKCFVLRKGYKENKIGILIAIIAGLYPLLSYVKYYFLKKNHYFFKSSVGAAVSDTILSVVATAKGMAINIFEYLTHLQGFSKER